MPRRYHVYPPEFQVLNVLSTAGASILAHRLLCCRSYISLWSCALWKNRAARILGRRPAWNGPTPSPPPKDNFEVTPIVTEEPYGYDAAAAEAEMEAADA